MERAKLGRFITKPLSGKSARVIVTMSTPGFIYRWWFGAHALKMLKHSILGFVGTAPVRTTVLGNVEGVGPQRRQAWLDDTRVMGQSLA